MLFSILNPSKSLSHIHHRVWLSIATQVRLLGIKYWHEHNRCWIGEYETLWIIWLTSSFLSKIGLNDVQYREDSRKWGTTSVQTNLGIGSAKETTWGSSIHKALKANPLQIQDKNGTKMMEAIDWLATKSFGLYYRRYGPRVPYYLYNHPIQIISWDEYGKFEGN